MKPLQLWVRLICMLLSLCILGASVGMPLTERLCRTSGRALVTVGRPAPEAATDCCGEVAPPNSASQVAQKIADASCCAVSVGYFHIAPDATGPVFSLDWPDLSIRFPAPRGWRTWATIGATTAQTLRLYASDASPPGRPVARALVLALHQMRH